MKRFSGKLWALLGVAGIMGGLTARCSVTVESIHDGTYSSGDRQFNAKTVMASGLSFGVQLVQGVMPGQITSQWGPQTPLGIVTVPTTPIGGELITILPTTSGPAPEPVNLGAAPTDGPASGNLGLTETPTNPDPDPTLGSGTLGEAPEIDAVPEAKSIMLAALVMLPIGMRTLRKLRERQKC